MNFFDAYDVPGTTTPPANAEASPSLNEEVSQVVGQLSRFWGGFRKQSQTALEAARKDLGQVVQQAQRELTKITSEALPSTSAPTLASPAAPEPNASATEQAASIPAEAEAEAESEAKASADTLFSRLQAALPPNLVSTVQTQLPESLKETLKHARVGSASMSALDFAQLRSTITTELHRMQGATEEYVHRSEDFLREAGEFLKDAVKVVPPEEGEAVYPGLVWDGTDVWMLPTIGGNASPAEASAGKGKGKEREGRSSSNSGRPSIDTLRAVATRAESMLKQLRHDPEVIKVDPTVDEKVREMYTSWVATEASSEVHGLGTTAWQKRIQEALADPVDGAALKATMDTLVPEFMTEDEFWARYFFRVYQVEREEARRKAIIQGTVDNDEDFSWEDEEEDVTPPTAITAPLTGAAGSTTGNVEMTGSAVHLTPSAAGNRSRVSTPGNASPRQSSEDSYDVVSSQVSNNEATENAPAQKTAASPLSQREDGEEASEDSDWE
ncbi:hypothetical protein BN946_scf184976.g32 [Trametes cinnabarina]|uniref:BSD domain-containing protein n=1 Tax=Pycnoporus cinnabarinus TaxID=5643 RepID=A0A060SAD0_PYCCI|nr:hypothetical protein BN946_scf184976.g32 [Trametes cinnabarina]